MNADVYRKYNVKPVYNDYTFVALAMAFTSDADKALKKIGMRPISGALAAVTPPNTMKTYKEVFKLDGLTGDMQDLSEVFENLYLQKSKSTPPGPAPAPAPKSAPASKPAPASKLPRPAPKASTKQASTKQK